MVEWLICVVVEWELCKGNILILLDGMWDQFLVCFFYVEIDDQFQVIFDVLDDLGFGCLMDCLVCGDVGFGKIEVVICVVFVVVMLGVQVVVIVLIMLLVW